MTSRRDPAELTASERLHEIAALLAAGVLRWRAHHQDSTANPQNRLDDRGGPGAPCGSRVLNPRRQKSSA